METPGHKFEDPGVEAYVRAIGKEMAFQRMIERSKEIANDKSDTEIAKALENGCDDFSIKDLDDFKSGNRHLMDPQKAFLIEAHLRALEKVSKDLSHIGQSEYEKVVKSFPDSSRIRNLF